MRKCFACISTASGGKIYLQSNTDSILLFILLHFTKKVKL